MKDSNHKVNFLLIIIKLSTVQNNILSFKRGIKITYSQTNYSEFSFDCYKNKETQNYRLSKYNYLSIFALNKTNFAISV